MNTVFLILKKDFKRYAWAVIALLALSLVDVYLYGTNTGMLDSKFNGALSFLSGTIGGILFFFIIVMVTQEETLSDPDAYWLARPLNRLHILASKICFLAILLGIGAISQGLILLLNGGVSRIGYSFATALLLGLAIWQWQIFLAAQTRSLPRYLLLLVGLVVGFYALMMFMVFSIADLGIDELGQLPGDTPSHLVATIQTLLWIATAASALTLFYLKRMKRYAWACLLPAVLLSAILTPRDTILGAGIDFLGQGDLEMELLDLRKSGTMHTNGKEFVTITGIFKVPETEKDLWVTPNYVSLRAEGSEIDISSNNSCQTLETTLFEGNEAAEVELFYIERDSLRQLADNFEISINYNLSTSTQKEIARLPIETGKGLTHNGNRIIFQDFYTSDSELTLSLDAYLPDFAIEPKPPSPAKEPLKGKYSMAVYHKSDKRLKESRFHSNWSGLDTKTSARIEIPHIDDKAVNDYEIIVSAREVEKTNFGHINSSDMSIRER
ncbi:MAG: hypothetical protein R6U56_09140 [Opitutales bacterium]